MKKIQNPAWPPRQVRNGRNQSSGFHGPDLGFPKDVPGGSRFFAWVMADSLFPEWIEGGARPVPAFDRASAVDPARVAGGGSGATGAGAKGAGVAGTVSVPKDAAHRGGSGPSTVAGGEAPSHRAGSVVGDEGAVTEIAGEYGSFTFPERVLQKLWLRGEVDDREAHLEDGRRVRVLEPGRWNHSGGPDFGSAVLEIDGCRRVGDVELHLRERDWQAHGHGQDVAYDGVMLHAVLFPTDARWTEGREGRRIPVLVLLPLLRRGLEEYAADEAVERLAGRPETRILDALLRCLPEQRAARVVAAGRARWEEKVAWARLRLGRLGWSAACHHAALQALGARANRAAMLRVAAEWPLSEWSAHPDLATRVWLSGAGGPRWTLQGVRPANHPRLRLEQYAAWVARVPAWPERLWDFPWPEGMAQADDVVAVRRRIRLAGLRADVSGAVCGGAVRSGRFDSLVCDAWLPLLAARGRDVAGLWFHWLPGELAATVRPALASFPGERVFRPLSQGAAQGVWAIGTGLDRSLQEAPDRAGCGA